MSGPDLDGVPGAWINSPEQTVRRPRRRRADDVMVPEAAFTSYYGRPVVKPAPWKHEIPAYLFLGGLAAGSALIASGAELTGRVTLQRNARLVALGALSGSGAVLVADLGKPSRFLNMMRTVKLTSPMSVGSWILAGQGTFPSAAAAWNKITALPKNRIMSANNVLSGPNLPSCF